MLDVASVPFLKQLKCSDVHCWGSGSSPAPLCSAAMDVLLTALSARGSALPAVGKAAQTLQALTDFAFQGDAAATVPAQQLAITHAGSLRFCVQTLRCHECGPLASSCMSAMPWFRIATHVRKPCLHVKW